MGRQAVRITADANVLVRALVGDDPKQSRAAQAELKRAERVAVAIPALCEFAWVLARGYKIEGDEIARVIRLLMNAEKVAADRPAAQAGLAVLEAGGDFADGAIAFEGRELGCPTFVSFDREAVGLIDGSGGAARSPA
jgi:predicted nucleic-acid-binding protein